MARSGPVESHVFAVDPEPLQQVPNTSQSSEEVIRALEEQCADLTSEIAALEASKRQEGSSRYDPSLSFKGLCLLCRSQNHRFVQCTVYPNMQLAKEKCFKCKSLHSGVCLTPPQNFPPQAQPMQASQPSQLRVAFAPLTTGSVPKTILHCPELAEVSQQDSDHQEKLREIASYLPT